MAKNFDPRYDPAFQPGYDGAAAVVEPVVEPVVERVETRPERVETRPEPVSVVEPVETRSEPRPVVKTRPPAEPQPGPTAANPWLRALWIVAAVFTVVGVTAQYAAQLALQGVYGGSAIDFYVVPATVQTLSPWFTLAGLFAGVSALVLSAVRWRPDPQ